MSHNTKHLINFSAHRPIWIAAFVLLIFIFLSVHIYLNEPLKELVTSQDALREKIESYGTFAPMVIIIYHVFQVIFAPLPGQAIDITNGYLFGPVKGSVISLTGIFIGTILAMSLARFFGRPLVKKLITPPKLKKFRLEKNHHKLTIIFLLFLIPGLPDDMICFLAGLTKIPLWQLVLVAIFGRSPTIIAAVSLGASGRSLSPLYFLIIAILVAVLLALILKFLTRTDRLKRTKEWLLELLGR